MGEEDSTDSMTDCSRDSSNEYEKAPIAAKMNGGLLKNDVIMACSVISPGLQLCTHNIGGPTITPVNPL